MNKGSENHKISSAQNIISAIAGSFTTAFFLTPLDVIKTRLQTDARVIQTKKCYLFCNGIMQHIYPLREIKAGVYEKPKGGLEAFFQIVRYEGIRALWSGLSPSLISALPTTVVYFAMYEQLKGSFLGPKQLIELAKNPAMPIPIWVPMSAGFLARICAQTVSAPIELFRIKKQAGFRSYGDILTQLKYSLNKHGYFSLWAALPPTLMRDCPFSSIYWGVYEIIRINFQVEKYPLFLFTMFSGFAAGAVCTVTFLGTLKLMDILQVAAFFTTPFDVITTRITVDIGEVIFSDGARVKQFPNLSITNKISQIYTENGIRGMFSGAFTRLLRVPLACGVMVTVYEHLNKFFVDYNEKTYNL